MIYLNGGKEYFGEKFIEEFEEILQECKKNSEFLFIHGELTKDDAEDICQNGMALDFPELYHTADFISSDDKLLYDKLKSWPHWECKFLVMCCVPKKSGKGGIPIWRETDDDFFLLLPEFIKGYIDVTKKNISINKLYSSIHDYNNMVEDKSYLPETAKLLGVSIPLSEIEFYDERGEDSEK